MTKSQQAELTEYMRSAYGAESVYVYNYGDNEPQQVQVFENDYQRLLVEIIGEKYCIYSFHESGNLSK